MCLAFWVFGCAPPHPLLLLAFNRDEFFERPTQPLHVWGDECGLIGGRDLDGGGTWLGVNAQGRVAFLTNIRGDGPKPPTHARKHASRGALTTSFLSSDTPPQEFAQSLQLERYDGFNLVVGDLRLDSSDGAFVYTNNQAFVARNGDGGEGAATVVSGSGRTGSSNGNGNRNGRSVQKSAEGGVQALEAGKVYGLSNAALGEWPKVTTGVEVLEGLLPSLASGSPVPWERIYGELLGDSTRLVPPGDSKPGAAGVQVAVAAATAAATAQEREGGGAAAAPAAAVDGGKGSPVPQPVSSSSCCYCSFEEQLEHLTSGRFVEQLVSPYGPYGTRSQTVVVVWHDGTGEMRERHRHPDGTWRESAVPLRMDLGAGGAQEEGDE